MRKLVEIVLLLHVLVSPDCDQHLNLEEWLPYNTFNLFDIGTKRRSIILLRRKRDVDWFSLSERVPFMGRYRRIMLSFTEPK